MPHFSPFALSALTIFVAACAGQKVDKARTALEAGQPDIAVGILGPVLADDPSNVQALVAMGDAELLLRARALSASDALGAKAALAKALEDYASARKAAPADCLAVSRDALVRLYAKTASDADMMAAWDICPAADIAAGGVSTKEYVDWRKQFKVETGAWTVGPGFGGPPAAGDNALVLAATTAVATGGEGQAEIAKYTEIVVTGVSASGALQFADRAHPIGVSTTAPVPQKAPGDTSGWGATGACRPRPPVNGICWTGPVPASDYWRAGIVPFEGGMTCTGNRIDQGGAPMCEVSYKTTGYATRELPPAAVLREPPGAVGRHKLLYVSGEACTPEVHDHLVKGELAPGLTHRDVLAVVPGCKLNPLAGVSFAGRSMVLSCTDKLGTFTFRDGLLTDAKWAAAPAP